MASPSNETSVPDQLIDDGGSTNCWLASAWSVEDIKYEWDYLFENGQELRECWYRFRPTTPEELANEDFLYETFGDHEMNGVVTDTVCIPCKADVPGAHRYWTTDR